MSGVEARLQELLALLAALAALGLRLAEEVRELRVVVALGVLDVLLEAQHVVEACLGEPDDVVGLVLGAGYLSGFSSGHGWTLLSIGYFMFVPVQRGAERAFDDCRSARPEPAAAADAEPVAGPTAGPEGP